MDGVLPDGLEYVRTTDLFDASTVPAGLLRAHRLAADTWGRLVVQAGTVRLVFEDDDGGGGGGGATIELHPGDAAVIPPGRPHHVELGGDGAFAVEFHRLDRD